MDFFNNFSTWASMGRKAITTIATVAITFGVINGTDAGTIMQGYDALTGGIVGTLGGIGMLFSIWASRVAKTAAATVTEIKAVAAQSDVAIKVVSAPKTNR